MRNEPVEDEPVTLGRRSSPRGEIVLRQRGIGSDAVHELIVNGAFAMDSSETSSERELARLVFPWSTLRGRMLVGGLGLGYTAAEALDLGISHIDVVELEEALVRWADEGLTPTLSRVAQDPRTHLVVGDIVDVLMGSASLPHPVREARSWDAIALDVDNGPDFLIHDRNASLYTEGLLAAAYARLSQGGRLAIWCQGPAPVLMDTLRAIGPTAHQHIFKVSRGSRRFAYAICTLDRPPTANGPSE